jgi:hypothetical protein
LINLDGRGYHVEIPMAAEFNEALESRNLEWSDIAGDKDEDDNDQINKDDEEAQESA